jgi:hypothetical protein
MPSKRERVASFFLNEANPYSKKRTFKIWHLAGVLAALAVAVMAVGSYLDNRAKREHATLEAAKAAARNVIQLAASGGSSPSAKTQGYVDNFVPENGGRSPRAGNRQYNASQLIKRGGGFVDVLPMGSVVRVRLLGKVESADSNSPVTAVVLDDAVSPSQISVIPKGTRVIGSGQVDQKRERLQVRFHSLVFPEGEQFSFSGLATMPDGSSGLVGDYSSGAFRKHASQFVGSFVGGVADGMKDRSVGQIGIPFEPGTLKNGALNGVAQSSLDYAKTSSEEFGHAQATISVPSGQDFILYLEQEFHQ